MGPLVITYITLFPLLLPVWQERAFNADDLMPGPYPVVVAAEQLALQRVALKTADRELRMAIVRELRETGLQEAQRILLDQLVVETDPGLLACVLQQLALSPHSAVPAAEPILAQLRHPDDAVRLWATALCGRFGPVCRERLTRIVAEDSSQAVREQAAAGLRDLDGAVPRDVYQTFRADPNPRVVAALTVGLCLGPDGAGAAPALAREWSALHDGVRFALVARLASMAAPLQEALLPLAWRDPSPGVRGECAAAMARLARPADRAAVLQLTQDPDPEVRRRAAAACLAYPGDDTLVALLDRLDDERTLVRREAEDTLVAANPAQPAGPSTAARLGRSRFPGRAHQCRVLARIGFAEPAAAVHAILRQEREPEGLRDAAFALGRFRFLDAAADVAARGTHASPVVREAVGEALGYLGVPATYPVLQALAFDPDEAVRHAAILAMARIADGTAFGDTIRKVLVATDPAQMSPANRAAAAWAAGRLRPVLPELVQRLKVQATEPVVPGPMGMLLFEAEFVLASVDFGLAQAAQDDAFAMTTFEEVLAIHQRVSPPGEPLPPDVKYTPTKEMLEYSRQAAEYLAGTPPEPRLRPTVSASFQVDRYEPR